MKISAIIAEYNPFHNGHKYQLDQVKKNSDVVIVIMSSSFTQRGTPAIINKFARAKTAIDNGANIVLELPCIYSCSNAEIFAKGAVFILNSLNIVNNLYFGSEDSLESLISINNKIKANYNLVNDKIKYFLSEGNSYLVAKEKSLDFLTENERSIIKRPNNILAFEYLKAIEYFNSDIKPFSVKRIHTIHGSNITYKSFSSGSNIRELVFLDKLLEAKNFMPENSFNALENNNINNLNNYFDIFKYLILSNKINYSKYFDYENGIENRFYKYINSYDINDFINKISTKRYTKSRISRLINNIVLDINSDLINKSFKSPYIRVLAMDSVGGKIIKSIDNDYVIDKFSKTNSFSDEILREIIDKEVFATNIYNQFIGGRLNEDFYKSPYFLKR